VQTPAAYVPPADVQIAAPPAEQAARERRTAIARGTGLTGRPGAAAIIHVRWHMREIARRVPLSSNGERSVT